MCGPTCCCYRGGITVMKATVGQFRGSRGVRLVLQARSSGNWWLGPQRRLERCRRPTSS